MTADREPQTESGRRLLHDWLFREMDEPVRMQNRILAIEAEARADAAREAQGLPVCPAGCCCRLGTDDADRNDCACDGPCCWNTWADFLCDAMDRPEEYAEYRPGGAYHGQPFPAAREAQPDPRVESAEPTANVHHEPGDYHRYRIECEVCGQRGGYHISVEPQVYE